MNTLTKQQVAKALSNIGPRKPFNVTFIKKDGSFRTFLNCMLDEAPFGAKGFSSAVPVMLDESEGKPWGSFLIENVVNLEGVK